MAVLSVFACLKSNATDLASKQVSACPMFVVTDSECTFLPQTGLQFKGIICEAFGEGSPLL